MLNQTVKNFIDGMLTQKWNQCEWNITTTTGVDGDGKFKVPMCGVNKWYKTKDDVLSITQAVDIIESNGERFNSLGLRINSTKKLNIVFLDFDNHKKSKILDILNKSIINKFKNLCYVEKSQSGIGYHVLFTLSDENFKILQDMYPRDNDGRLMDGEYKLHVNTDKFDGEIYFQDRYCLFTADCISSVTDLVELKDVDLLFNHIKTYFRKTSDVKTVKQATVEQKVKPVELLQVKSDVELNVKQEVVKQLTITQKDNNLCETVDDINNEMKKILNQRDKYQFDSLSVIERVYNGFTQGFEDSALKSDFDYLCTSVLLNFTEDVSLIQQWFLDSQLATDRLKGKGKDYKKYDRKDYIERTVKTLLKAGIFQIYEYNKDYNKDEIQDEIEVQPEVKQEVESTCVNENDEITVKINELDKLCISTGFNLNCELKEISTHKRTTPILPPFHPTMTKTVQSRKGKKLISHTKVQSAETYNKISGDNDWLFKDFIKNNTLFTFSGFGHSGKTTLLVRLAHQHRENLTTFILDNDNGTSVQKGNGYAELTTNKTEGDIFNHNTINIYNSTDYVETMDAIALFMAQCEFENPNGKMLLIIDSLYKAVPDNISNTEAHDFLMYQTSLINRFKNLSIGLIQHLNKKGELKGNTSYFNGVDCVYPIKMNKDTQNKKLYINVDWSAKNGGKSRGLSLAVEQKSYCLDYSDENNTVFTEIKPRSENADVIDILRETVINSTTDVKREVLLNVLKSLKITNATKQQSILTEFKTAFTDIKVNRVKSADVYVYIKPLSEIKDELTCVNVKDDTKIEPLNDNDCVDNLITQNNGGQNDNILNDNGGNFSGDFNDNYNPCETKKEIEQDRGLVESNFESNLEVINDGVNENVNNSFNYGV